tara:strand:+ start:127 stop:522 length:396 start_codon:yes stop_codon:yes gene_type:complete
MDITKFNTVSASSKARTLKLKNPFTNETIEDEDGNNLEIMVYGVKSIAGKNAIAERDRKGKDDKQSDDEKARIGAEFLAALTAGWSDNFELGDEQLKYNNENAVKLYLSEDWIADQVLSFALNLKNYDPNA